MTVPIIAAVGLMSSIHTNVATVQALTENQRRHPVEFRRAGRQLSAQLTFDDIFNMEAS
jgi:hypothetical protein